MSVATSSMRYGWSDSTLQFQLHNSLMLSLRKGTWVIPIFSFLESRLPPYHPVKGFCPTEAVRT